MKSLIVLAALLPIAFSVSASAMTVKGCNTGDSAVCSSIPNCHWDVNRRGCYEGAPEHSVDPCASHEDEGICKTDKTLGCGWNAEKKVCETQKK